MIKAMLKFSAIVILFLLFTRTKYYAPVYWFIADAITPIDAVQGDSVEVVNVSMLGFPSNAPVSVALWQPDIEDANKKHPTVSPALIAAIMTVESNGDPNAISRDASGNPIAYGLMQIVPRYAGADMCPDADLLDPIQNINCGTKYLAWLISYFDGDMEKVIMGYHGGHGYGANPRPIDREYLRRVNAVLVTAPAAAMSSAVGGGGTVSGSLMDKYYKGGYQMSQGAHMAGIYTAPNGATPSCYDYVGESKTIYAPFDGKITAAGSDGYCGVYGCDNSQLEISSNDGRFFFILHGIYTVGYGDTVKEGQVIGTESDIGNSKGVHTHACIVE